MVDSIQQAVKSHDSYQIELKLDYELMPAKQTRYQVETYFFVPQNLGISAETYTKADFYRDTQNYIRLKTPTLILRDYVESDSSPIVMLERRVSQPNWVNDSEHVRPIIKDLKLLAAMVKSSIREHFNHIQKRITDMGNGKVHLVINNLIEEFLRETDNITLRYRGLFATFNLPNVDEQILIAYHLTDESISLLIEEGLIDLYEIVNTFTKKAAGELFKDQISARVKGEIKHRKQLGYGSLLGEDSDNETYMFRASALKKYASSVLFLSADITREGKRLEQIGYAVAAGVSMIFATVLAFYFQQLYGNFTYPFFVALVIGYMFKDRIKELGRGLFARQMQTFLYDRRKIIYSQDGQRLGRMREKVRFIDEGEIPRRVFEARARDRFTDLDNDGRGETVIRYQKEIVLEGDEISRIFNNRPTITSINDIIRYDIRAYLNKMGESVQSRNYLIDGEIRPVTVQKVYHLNIISKYAATYPKKDKTYSRLRFILNQHGIKRIEDVKV